MNGVINPSRLAERLTELWSPRVIAELDDNFVKVAKVRGEFPWHEHEHEDELFLVLAGRLRIEYEKSAVTLGPGELHVVPKGTRHRTVAEEECRIMLIERKSTQHSGREISDRTRSIADQLRPIAPP
ncbi:MAG: cupin domain-containing protein [Phycisphaerae bacterium]|nr:cupin domain-containing protein [Phycisphaerae bacterium]